MKKFILSMAVALAAAGFQAQAFDLSSILGNAGSAVSGLVDGLLTQSDISVEQMAGTWTATGSAVCFQSENFLQKAGGSAVASTIESKLNPYYKQYGLTGSVLTINSDGTFTLKVKGISLSGTITKLSDGNFNFSFKALGSVSIGTIKAYVEKPVSGLNVMFDASKLMTLISAITKLTGSSLANTASSLLNSYDGLCVGFAFSGTGSGSTQSVWPTTPSTNNSGTTNSGTTNSGTTNSSTQQSQGSQSTNSTNNTNINNTINNIANGLKGLFGK